MSKICGPHVQFEEWETEDLIPLVCQLDDLCTPDGLCFKATTCQEFVETLNRTPRCGKPIALLKYTRRDLYFIFRILHFIYTRKEHFVNRIIIHRDRFDIVSSVILRSLIHSSY